MENKDYYDTKTLRKEFGIAESTQAKYRAEKTIPFSKVGGFIYYKKEEIYAWIDNHLHEATGVLV